MLVSDIHDHVLTTRWPVFAGAVAEQTRARALFALPLHLGTINLGVLDLYRDHARPRCREHDLRDARRRRRHRNPELLAAPVHASEAEAAGHPITDGHSTGKQRPVGWHADKDGRGEQVNHNDGDGLDKAWLRAPWWDGLWNDRAEVRQATGMILAQLDVSAQDAFVRLRAPRLRPPVGRWPMSPATSSRVGWCSPREWT